MSNEKLSQTMKELGYRGPKDKTRKNMTQVFVDRPAAFLVHLGIVERPDLLTHTAFQFDNDVVYKIDEVTAKRLKNKDPMIRMTTGEVFSRERVLKSLKETWEFDQPD